jgi:hypothetical protein
LIALEAGEDGINDQRCLYLDRVNNVNSELSKKGASNFAELENMKQEILSKEEELVAIGDAQKITAEDINLIHKIIKLDAKAKQQRKFSPFASPMLSAKGSVGLELGSPKAAF